MEIGISAELPWILSIRLNRLEHRERQRSPRSDVLSLIGMKKICALTAFRRS